MGICYALYHPRRHERFALGKGCFDRRSQPGSCDPSEWSRWMADAYREWDPSCVGLADYFDDVAARIVAWMAEHVDVVLTDDHSDPVWSDDAPWPPITGSCYAKAGT